MYLLCRVLVSYKQFLSLSTVRGNDLRPLTTFADEEAEDHEKENGIQDLQVFKLELSFNCTQSWTHQFKGHNDDGGHEWSVPTVELAGFIQFGPGSIFLADDDGAPDEHGQIDKDHGSVGEAEHSHDAFFPGLWDATSPGQVDVYLSQNVED